MPDRYQFTNNDAKVVREMNDCCVLHVGPRTNDDSIDVAP